MAEDYNRLRLVKNKKGDEILQIRSPIGEWYTCKNTTSQEDAEDLFQFHQILPKFRHPLLKKLFDL